MKFVEIMLAALIASSCKVSNFSSTKASPSQEPTNKISQRMSWEQWLVKICEKSDTLPKDAAIFALTSSGGFHGGGVGHYYVFKNKDGSGVLLKTAAQMIPKTVEEVRHEIFTIPKKILDDFLKSLQPPVRENFKAKGFDFYHYKLMSITLSNSQITQKETLCEFDDPSIGSQLSPKHIAIMKAFTKLYQQVKP